MPDSGLVVKGMKEFRQGLRAAAGPEMTKWIAKANKAVATDVLGKIKTRAQQTFQPSSRAARAITARGSQTAARIAMSPARDPRVLGSEFGTLVHYVGGRGIAAASMKRRVFPPWSGNQWTPGEAPAQGVGYAVHPVLREQQEQITAEYLTYIEKALWKAFDEMG